MSVATRIEKAASILGIEPGASAETLADLAWLAGILSDDAELIQQETPEAEAKTSEPGPSKTTPSEVGSFDTPPTDGSGPTPREDDDRVAVFSRTQTTQADFVPATLVSIPAADALPTRLAIERALKPFLKRFPSPTLRELDLAATVEASAELRVTSPVFRPVAERWFSVMLLVERSEVMELWSQTIRELQALMERHGAFRTVRTLFYEVLDEAVVLTTVSGQRMNAKSVADPDGRSLCIFLTHGVSFNWGGAPLQNFVRSVGRSTVVAIVQMLPQRLWPRTALGTAADTVYSVYRASPNASLRRVDPIFLEEDSAHDGSSVPLLTLQPGAVERWARFVMEPRRILHPAVSLQNAWNQGSAKAAKPKVPTPEEQLAKFHAAASPLAFQLLRALAYVPLTLPVMKLLQQSLSSENNEAHLAEILLSGLIERLTPRDTFVSKDQVLYDFVPEVRELLLQTLSSREIEELDHVMRPARKRLREYVERKLNGPMPDFMALISDPNGLERLPPEARPFLEISRSIYEMRGVLDRRKSTQSASDLRNSISDSDRGDNDKLEYEQQQATEQLDSVREALKHENPEAALRELMDLSQFPLDKKEVDAAFTKAVQQYGQEYENVRATRQPGDARTEVMDGMVVLIKKVAHTLDIAPELAVQLMSHKDAGPRIMGLAIAQGTRSSKYLDLAISMISNAITPFEQYHAMVLADAQLGAASLEQMLRLEGSLLEPGNVSIESGDASRNELRKQMFRRMDVSLGSAPDYYLQHVELPSRVRYEDDPAARHGPFVVTRGTHDVGPMPSFQIGTLLVTNRLFHRFLRSDPYLRADSPIQSKESPPKSRYSEAKFPRGAGEHPVTGICYLEASAFVDWLNRGSTDPEWQWVLPTEDMWELAARSPRGLLYPWGEKFETGKCNSVEAKLKGPSDVRRFAGGQSWCGCFDMAGNAWEFVVQRQGSKSCVLRGGSYKNNEHQIKNCFRLQNVTVTTRAADFGFRCAKVRYASPLPHDDPRAKVQPSGSSTGEGQLRQKLNTKKAVAKKPAKKAAKKAAKKK